MEHVRPMGWGEMVHQQASGPGCWHKPPALASRPDLLFLGLTFAKILGADVNS